MIKDSLLSDGQCESESHWQISRQIHVSNVFAERGWNRPQTILFFLSPPRANTASASLRKRRAMCNPQDLTRAKIPISCSPDPRANKGYLRQWDCVSAVRVHVVHHNATHVYFCPYGTQARARAHLPVSSNFSFLLASSRSIILS